MKTRKRLSTKASYVLIIIILISSSVFTVTFVHAGLRGTYIYDRADVIDDKWRDKIHNYLLKLDENTTAEIVIFTLPSLSGHGIKYKSGREIHDIEDLANDIFNELPLEMPTYTKPGIGKPVKNNGVLILVVGFADKEIEGKIETGDGMEAVLPDLLLWEIITEYDFKARLIKGEVGESFYDVVKAMGKVIYENFLQEQAEAAEQEAEEDTQPAEEIHIPVFGILAFLSVGAAIAILAIFVIPAILRWNRKRTELKRRKANVTKAIKNHKRDNKELEEELIILGVEVEDYPGWARKEAEDDLLLIEQKTTSAVKLVEQAENYLRRKDLGSAEFCVDDIDEIKEEIIGLLAVVTSELPRQIEQYRRGAPEKLKLASKRHKEIEAFVKDLQQKDYKVGKETVNLKNIGRNIGHFSKMLEEEDVVHKDVYESADSLLYMINEIEDTLRQRLKKKSDVDSALRRLPRQIERARKGVPHAQEVLKAFAGKHPKRVWQIEDRNLDRTPNLLNSAEQALEEATELNSMEVQNFDKAWEKILEAQRSYDSARRFIDGVFDKKEKLHKAKNDAPGLLKNAEGLVGRALDKVKHRDVSSSSERVAEEAEENLLRAERMYNRSRSGGVLMDWLLIVVLLTTAMSLARRAITEADTDVMNARRRREEEERRRREEERRRREETYYRSRSSRSSDWDSSSSGGFGGGAFGGGGGRSSGGGIKF